LVSQVATAQLNIENYRAIGYAHKINGNIDSSIINYKIILQIEPNDYDATLALARLFAAQENQKESEFYYARILDKDSADTEAWNGLGDLYLMNDKVPNAIIHYKKAIYYLPAYVPYYFSLAKAYSWDGKLDDAIETYTQILKIDSTYSEAYAGIGKMYSWKEKPYTAKKYYLKAMALDPESVEIGKEFEAVLNALKYSVTARFWKMNEAEQNYRIDAFIQKYSVQKRLSNHFDLSANVLLDNSDRDLFNTIGDTQRLYSNYWAVLRFILKNHSISAFGGYSMTDSRLSSYGLSYKGLFDFGKLKVTSVTTAEYQYFFYWNQVGGKSVEENITLSYKNHYLQGGLKYGLLDSLLIQDYYNDKYGIDFNSQISYNISLGTQVLKKPQVKIAANYSFMNFKYKSPLYYSPYERNLTGMSTSLYHKYRKWYVYVGANYNIGTEANYEQNVLEKFEKENLSVNNWGGSAELGYNLKTLTFALNWSRFYNPYYANYFVALAISGSF